MRRSFTGDAAGPAIESLETLAKGRQSPELVRQQMWAAALAESDREQLAVVFRQLPPLDRPLEWSRLARVLDQLQGELSAEGLDFAAVAARVAKISPGFETRRWEALAEVQRRYLKRAAALKSPEREAPAAEKAPATVAFVAVSTWTAQRRNYASGLAKTATVAALTPAPEEEAGRFDDFGAIKRTEPVIAAIPREIVEICQTPAEQAERLISLVGEERSVSPKAEIALVILDDEVEPYFEARAATAGIDVPSPIPLSRSRPFRLIRSLGEYLHGAEFPALQKLVRNSDFEASLDRDLAMEKPATRAGGLFPSLDKYAIEHLPDIVPSFWRGYRGVAEPCQRLIGAAGRLLTAFEGTPQRLAEWARRIGAFLRSTYA
ncbi:MAG TPA: hypothetical protein VNC50_19650, partial [Planctomycetia bacterium]|nr:hypothetical protein [Planctomycetia bacterium]